MDGWREFWTSGKIADYLTYKKTEKTKEAPAAGPVAVGSVTGGGVDEHNG